MQRDALANRIAEKLLVAIEKDDYVEYMKKYRALSCVIDHHIVFSENEREYSAFAFDINDDGALAVRLEDGSVRYLNSGEISIKKF